MTHFYNFFFYDFFSYFLFVYYKLFPFAPLAFPYFEIGRPVERLPPRVGVRLVGIVLVGEEEEALLSEPRWTLLEQDGSCVKSFTQRHFGRRMA